MRTKLQLIEIDLYVIKIDAEQMKMQFEFVRIEFSGRRSSSIDERPSFDHGKPVATIA
jgi:hypothetical protein